VNHQTITITESGAPKPYPEPKQAFDIQDGCLVIGFFLLETGTALFSIPTALILAGLLFIVTAGMIQRTKGNKN
jgi:hypothetical protein